MTEADVDSVGAPVVDAVIVAICVGVTVCLVEDDGLCSAVCVIVRVDAIVVVWVCVTDDDIELTFDAVGVISELDDDVCVCVVDGDGLTLGQDVPERDALADGVGD